jgi:hypothetical protein
VNLPAILHRGRQRQRLAARAGAEIKHLHPGLRAGQLGHHLRAFVLNLEPALLECRLDLDIRVAPKAIDRRDTQPVPRKPRRPGARFLERLRYLVAFRPERVDTQVEGRSPGQRPALLDPCLAEGFFEMRRTPVGAFGAYDLRRRLRPARRDRRTFIIGERRRREAVAIERSVERFRGHGRFENDRAEAGGARCIVVQQPDRRTPPPQRVVDDVTDGGPVAGSREAMRQAPVLQRIRRWAVTSFDIFKNFDGRSQPSAESHSPPSCRLPELPHS